MPGWAQDLATKSSPAPTMNARETLEVTLPAAMVAGVRSRVATGEYATESDVIPGLRMLFARDQAVDDWLCADAAPALDALKEDPGRALPSEAARARLLARQQR